VLASQNRQKGTTEVKDVNLKVVIRVPDDTDSDDVANELGSLLAENLDVSGTWFPVGHPEVIS
jgi:hypothetical protein